MLRIALQILQALASIYTCLASPHVNPNRTLNMQKALFFESPWTHYIFKLLYLCESCSHYLGLCIPLPSSTPIQSHTYTFHIQPQPSSSCLTPPHQSRLNSINYLTLKPFQFLPWRDTDLFLSGNKVNLPILIGLLVFIYDSLMKQSLWIECTFSTFRFFLKL